MKKVVTSIFIFIIAAQFSVAQSKLRFEHFTTENGLSSNWVRSLAQDSAGYLWVGTGSGLNRYDGNSFRVFLHDDHDSTSLSNNYINKLFIDHAGNLWIGTANGMCIYNPVTEKFRRFLTVKSATEKPLSVICFAEDKAYNLWIGTSQGVKIFDAKTSELKSFVDATDTTVFYSSPINALLFDRQGNIWMGSDASLGIRVMNPELHQSVFDDLGKVFGDTIMQNNVFDFFETEDGRIWIGNGIGLYSFDAQRRLKLFVKNIEAAVLNRGGVSSICQKGNNLWFGLLNNEIYSGIGKINLQTNEATWFDYRPEDPDNLTWGYCPAIFADRTGLIWIGTSRGLNKLNERKQYFKSFRQFPNLKYNSADNVYAIAKDQNGVIWLGTDGRMLKRFDIAVNKYTNVIRQRFVSEGLYSILQLDSKRFFLGTQGRGVLLYNSATNSVSQLVSPQDRTELRTVGGLAYDSTDHLLWIGWFSGGVTKYNMETGEKKNFAHSENDPESLSSDQVTAVMRDHEGFIWVGTGDIINTPRSSLGNGLDKLDPATGKFMRFIYDPSDSTSISNNNVHCIKEDDEGGIWVGTTDGLNYLPHGQKTFKRFYTKDGLPGNFVSILQFDKQGFLWIGTYANGLCRYDPKTNSFLYFDKSDGLQDLRFNRQSSFIASDGELFFGGVGGFNSIYPDQLNADEKLPSASISRILINGKRDSLLIPDYAVKSLHQKYNQANLQFFFFCSDYSASEKNIFTYKLDGFDPDWVKAGAEHSAKYTNLKAGDYVLRVKIESADGLRSGNERLISITIDPPFWQTWWFYSLVVIAAAAGVFGFVRLRLQTLRRQKKVLEAKVSQRTEQLQLEKEKVAAEKEIAEQQRARAEQSEKFKQQFLANMSHEIRTPMNAISGMTNLLLQKNPREDQLKYLEGIHKSSNNLIVIINDILDLSKIEAGKIEMEKIDFRPREVVELVYETMKFKAEEKGLNFSTDIDRRLPEVLVGDPVRLNQVLTNLTGNAIKFTSKGSVVIRVKLMAQKSSSAIVQFLVSDTGIGIAKDKLDKVFESFTQASSETSRKFGGTGLGLTISKQLIELQGGKISLQSEEGKGTTFSFIVEYALGTSAHLQQREFKIISEEDIMLLNGMRIIIADDNEYNRVVAEDTLKAKAPNIQIATATNGKEVLEILKSESDHRKSEIILMDLHMPEMDGYETSRAIRNPQSAICNHDIPIVALTASVIKSDLEKCLAAGMNGYIPKPFTEVQLINGILAAIKKEEQIELFSAEEFQEQDSNFSSEKNSNGQVVDLTFLKNFCEGDEARMKKYITMFLESIPPFQLKIEDAIIKNDFAEIGRQVHAMKAKFAMMGIKEAQTLSVEIEDRCRENKAENITVLLEKLISVCDQSGSELATHK